MVVVAIQHPSDGEGDHSRHRAHDEVEYLDRVDVEAECPVKGCEDEIRARSIYLPVIQVGKLAVGDAEGTIEVLAQIRPCRGEPVSENRDEENYKEGQRHYRRIDSVDCGPQVSPGPSECRFTIFTDFSF